MPQTMFLKIGADHVAWIEQPGRAPIGHYPPKTMISHCFALHTGVH